MIHSKDFAVSGVEPLVLLGFLEGLWGVFTMTQIILGGALVHICIAAITYIHENSQQGINFLLSHYVQTSEVLKTWRFLFVQNRFTA